MSKRFGSDDSRDSRYGQDKGRGSAPGSSKGPKQATDAMKHVWNQVLKNPQRFDQNIIDMNKARDKNNLYEADRLEKELRNDVKKSTQESFR